VNGSRPHAEVEGEERAASHGSRTRRRFNRWPRALRSGHRPDPRLTLANERTFLAWIRTVLGLIAAALAIEAFGDLVLSPSLRSPTVFGLLVVSAILTVSAAWRWASIEIAMRHGEELPLPAIGLFLAGTVVVVTVALVVWFSR
jgi:putative membrane protein